MAEKKEKVLKINERQSSVLLLWKESACVSFGQLTAKRHNVEWHFTMRHENDHGNYPPRI